MTKNQFTYTRREALAPKEGEEGPQFRDFIDSFDINRVIRTVATEDDRLALILDDTHERIQNEVPVYSNSGKQTGTKSIRFTYQSEIFLSPEDSIRYRLASTVIV